MEAERAETEDTLQVFTKAEEEKGMVAKECISLEDVIHYEFECCEQQMKKQRIRTRNHKGKIFLTRKWMRQLMSVFQPLWNMEYQEKQGGAAERYQKDMLITFFQKENPQLIVQIDKKRKKCRYTNTYMYIGFLEFFLKKEGFSKRNVIRLERYLKKEGYQVVLSRPDRIESPVFAGVLAWIGLFMLACLKGEEIISFIQNEIWNIWKHT